MGKCIDLTGMKFGRWTVLRRDVDRVLPRTGVSEIQWTCRCDCGTHKAVAGYALRRGSSQSCGCLNRDNFLSRMVGKRYGRLVVLNRTEGVHHPGGQIATQWLCQCDCGNITSVATGSLSKGTTQSCGCIHREMMVARRSLDLKDQRFGHLVAIEYVRTVDGHRMWQCICDCGREIQVSAKSLHSGGQQSCGCRGVLILSYDTVHAHVRRIRGKAETYLCIDCGEQACDWSCSHDAELIRNSKGWYYSLDIMDYVPRCKKDHAAYDRGFRAQL